MAVSAGSVAVPQEQSRIRRKVKQVTAQSGDFIL